MTPAESQALIAKLFAAFPAARREQATVEVYAEAMAPMTMDRALEAVTNAIRQHRDARSIPPLAEILDAYTALRDKYIRPQLNEAPLTEEQRADNVRRMRELAARYAPRPV